MTLFKLPLPLPSDMVLLCLFVFFKTMALFDCLVQVSPLLSRFPDLTTPSSPGTSLTKILLLTCFGEIRHVREDSCLRGIYKCVSETDHLPNNLRQHRPKAICREVIMDVNDVPKSD